MKTTRDGVMRLLVQHQSMLKAYIFSMVGDWSITVETIQETTVYLCNHWEDWRPGTDFGRWLRVVGRNRARELIRRERRHESRRVKLADLNLAEAIPERTWARAEVSREKKLRALNHCVGKLPSESRRILRMRYVERKECREIASIINTKVASVYKRLLRLRDALRDCVARKVMESF